MAHVSDERAPAFTSEELEKLVDGVFPQYMLLYGPPDKQVSAYQKKDIWRAIAKDVRTLGFTTDGALTAVKDGRTFAAGARRRQRPSWGWPPNVTHRREAEARRNRKPEEGRARSCAH
ncbi:hypothetical protein NDU88_006190 [Pleurodeles waltl]|uniref:Myb/SANT-like DNA-binding domain-containing protein n=1 Tax=Pleurodeles waltl TaxID=8319 RepID=A0AAV7TEU1_PLEWA|nr:hypothetical protein NDU88_006190 [Pleurodeles waltl]